MRKAPTRDKVSSPGSGRAAGPVRGFGASWCEFTGDCSATHTRKGQIGDGFRGRLQGSFSFFFLPCVEKRKRIGFLAKCPPFKNGKQTKREGREKKTWKEEGEKETPSLLYVFTLRSARGTFPDERRTTALRGPMVSDRRRAEGKPQPRGAPST